MNYEDSPTLISLLLKEGQRSALQLPLFIQWAQRINSRPMEARDPGHLPLAIDDYGLNDSAVYIEPRPICKVDLLTDAPE